DLVFSVKPCGTCEFFWPRNSPQAHGPCPAYDFRSNTSIEKSPEGKPNSFVWLRGITQPPTFPDAEVMDGCRNAPNMMIGMNPNLKEKTASSWCYPSFSSAD